MARSLEGVAASVRVLALPALPEKGDVSRLAGRGADGEELKKLARSVGERSPVPAHSIVESGTGGLALTRLSTSTSQPEEEIRWLAEGMLPAGGISALAAKPKTGKSTLARQLAVCVARGEPFLGRETTKSPVIYSSRLREKRSEALAHFRAMGATQRRYPRFLW